MVLRALVLRGGLAMAAAAVAADAADAAGRARVTVTGRAIDVNGVRTVPPGLFGLHAAPIDPSTTREWGVGCYRHIHRTEDVTTPTVTDGHPEYDGVEMFIDCVADRYHPATVLTKTDYVAYLEDLGERLARAAKSKRTRAYVEFWNEPFLNWAAKPGVNYDPKFYEAGEARVGAPMRIRGWDRPLRHLVWSKQKRTVHAESGATSIYAYLAHAYIGKHRPVGYEFTFRGKRFRNVTTWWGEDRSQTSWYSGLQNLQFYNWMLVPYARAIKRANPDVQVIAGWNYMIGMDDWAMWRTLYKPTIDAAARYIDGVNEHHYGIGARRVASWYEIVAAYGRVAHDKRLVTYCTECGGDVDSQLPGNERLGGGKGPLAVAARTYAFHMRDLVNVLANCPDKLAARVIHGPPQKGVAMGGREACLRMLKPLRGSLVDARSSDRSVWPVASIDGDRHTVVVFNDHMGATDVSLAVTSPRGARLRSCERSHVRVDAGGETLAIERRALHVRPGRFTETVRVPGRTAVAFTFVLDGVADVTVGIERRQFFAREFFSAVGPERPYVTRIDVDPECVASAASVRVRAVLERAGAGEARMYLNGNRYEVPGVDWVVDVHVAREHLRARNLVIFEVSSNDAGGYRVDTASVVVDSPAQ